MQPSPPVEGEPGRQTFLSASHWEGGRNLLRGIAVLAVTVVVLGILFAKVDGAAVVSAFGMVPPHAWLLAAGVPCALVLTSSSRWYVVLRAMGQTVPWVECARIIVGICPVNAVSPSKSGDLLRIWCLRGRVGAMVTAGTLVVERLNDVLMLALFAAVGAAYFGDGRILLIALLVVVAVVALLGIAIFLPELHLPGGIQRRLREASVAIRLLVRRPGAMLAIVSITALNWLLIVVMVAALLSGIGAHVPFDYVLAALPIAVFVGLIPVTLGGMGTRDAAMVYLFSGMVPASQVVAVSLLYTAFLYWFLGIAGLPFLRGVLR